MKKLQSNKCVYNNIQLTNITKDLLLMIERIDEILANHQKALESLATTVGVKDGKNKTNEL